MATGSWMTGIWETGSGKSALSYRPCTRYASHLLFVWFWDLFSVFWSYLFAGCWCCRRRCQGSGVGVLMVAVKMCTSGSGVSHLCLTVFLVCVAGVLWALWTNIYTQQSTADDTTQVSAAAPRWNGPAITGLPSGFATSWLPHQGTRGSSKWCRQPHHAPITTGMFLLLTCTALSFRTSPDACQVCVTFVTNLLKNLSQNFVWWSIFA